MARSVDGKLCGGVRAIVERRYEYGIFSEESNFRFACWRGQWLSREGSSGG